MVRAAAQRLDLRVEAVDSNGILPLRGADRVFPTAHAFRRFLQKELRPHLQVFPIPTPWPIPSSRSIGCRAVPRRGGSPPCPGGTHPTRNL